MSVDHDAALARTLHRVVTELLTWLDEYPDDQVDANAVATIRQSIDWVVERLPADERDRLVSGNPDPSSLKTVTGLVVDLVWWLDTCGDDDVDPRVAVNLLEGVAHLHELPGEQRERLLDVLDELAAAEPHHGRQYELRRFAFAMGLVDDEPDDEAPPVREWVNPKTRAAGPTPR
jgi:hypothetical protein